MKQGNVRTYHCRVGHGWSPSSLLEQQGSTLEDSLGMALRSLDERASLARRLAGAAGSWGHTRAERHFTQTAEDARRAAADIRGILKRRAERDESYERGLGS